MLQNVPQGFDLAFIQVPLSIWCDPFRKTKWEVDISGVNKTLESSIILGQS